MDPPRRQENMESYINDLGQAKSRVIRRMIFLAAGTPGKSLGSFLAATAIALIHNMTLTMKHGLRSFLI
jgi:hypothetical protein